jgi:hypothetical protein
VPVSQPPKPESDEYQIVVEATPPPQRRPRTPNPAVDDVIASGEIAPRSLIIRSQSQPVMPAFREDPTEQTQYPPPPVVAARRRKLSFLWLAAAVVPAIAAVALGAVHPAAQQPVRTAEAESVAQLLGTTLDGEAQAAKVRVEAIASSSMLRAAIQTDAQTLADMARDNDIAFPHGANEAIEVIQVSANERKTLLKIPSTAPDMATPPAGTAKLERRGDAMFIIVDAPVTGQSGAPAGEIALAAPIDLSRIQKRTYEQLTGVTLTGFGPPISLGGGAAVPNGAPITAQIPTTVAAPGLAIAAMVATPPADSSASLIKGLRYGCAALALLLLALFGVSLLVRR